jgi:hypothetical protein
MRIRPLTFLLVIGLLSISCSHTVEIPEKKVGVVYDTRTEVVSDDLLKPGKHSIGIYSDVVLFDINDQKVSFSFDVLFKDATSAIVEFSANYSLKTDNLPKVCQKLGQPALDYPIDSIVVSEARSQVRDLMMELDKDKLTKEIIFDRIKNNLRTVNPTAEMIEIKSFSRGRIRLNQAVAQNN